MARKEFSATPEVQARLLSELGTIYVNLADFNKAEALLLESMRLHHRGGTPTQESLADSLFRLACLLWYTGDFDASVALMRESWRRHVDLYGETDPRASTVQLLLAFTYALNDENLNPDALKLVEFAKTGLEGKLAEDDPRRLWLEFLEHFVRIRNGDPLSALAFVTAFRRRVELFHGDARPFQVALSWFDGIIAYMSRRYDKAIEKFEEGIAYFEKEKYAYHPAAIQMRLMHARALEQNGRIDDAEKVLRTTLALCERHYRFKGYHHLVSREISRFGQHRNTAFRAEARTRSRNTFVRVVARQSRLLAADNLYGSPSIERSLQLGRASRIQLPAISPENDKSLSIEVSCVPDEESRSAQRSILLEMGDVALGTDKGRYFAEFRRDKHNVRSAYSATPVVAGQRVHLLLERGGGAVELFVNGVPQAKSPLFKTDSKGQVVGEPAAPSTAVSFTGLIDAIRISQGWPGGSYFLPPREWETAPSTFALFRMQGDDAAILVDSSGNGRHGKVENGAWNKPAPVAADRADDGSPSESGGIE